MTKNIIRHRKTDSAGVPDAQRSKAIVSRKTVLSFPNVLKSPVVNLEELYSRYTASKPGIKTAEKVSCKLFMALELKWTISVLG